VLSGGQRDELAEAMDDSQVILIPRDAFLRTFAGNADFAFGVTKLVGLRRQRIERRLKSLLFRSVRQRLADLLIELAERYGVSKDGGTEIQLRLSHQELASAIGSTRESVTLVLGELAIEGLVENRRNRVTLLNPKRLAESLELDSVTIAAPVRLAKDALK
jgi:CRP/FNR family cyclic AMP-dependent transcriptional regulator